MSCQLFDRPCSILALEVLDGSQPPAAHHYGWIAPFILLTIFAAYSYRCLAHSDDRRMLLYKWAATVGLVFLMFVILYVGVRYYPPLVLYFLIPAVILGFVWMPNLVSIFLRPLTAAFDGGTDEVEPKPFYFIATAKRTKGLYQEAIAEIQRQLENFPSDVDGAMLLASIQAENLHDLPTAQATITELLEQGKLTPQQRATALHSLADWQLQFGRDTAAARVSLEGIVTALPDSQFAHAAQQRLATLDGYAATRDFRENARFVVRQRERDIGLRQSAPAEPETFDPGLLATEYVSQLEKHPTDTETREKLAVLYAESFDRLDLAIDQLEQLISVPDETPKHVAHWLNLLATLHIRVAHDENRARQTLLRIAERFPTSALADLAAMRLANLHNELRFAAAAPSKALGDYEKDVGLKRPVG